MTVGDVEVHVRRAAPFTATEHARGAAMAALVSDVLRRAGDPGIVGTGSNGRRIGGGATPSYAVEGDSVAARIDDVVVGRATLLADEEPGVVPVSPRASTPAGSAAASAPSCWSTRPVWPTARAPTRSC